MNFLELVQRVVQYSGMANSGPSSVVGQTGDFARAVTYVQDAHAEIQQAYQDWDFLWSTGSLTTSSGLAEYDGASDLNLWDVMRLRLEGELIDYTDWHDYEEGDVDDAKPTGFTVRPDNRIVLTPTPDDSYTVSYHYYRTPKVLSGNSDEPLIPSRYHLAIVGRALVFAGIYDAAEDVQAQGAEMYQRFFEQLTREQLPRRRQTFGRMESADITVVPE